jgi:hypothetical protein
MKSTLSCRILKVFMAFMLAAGVLVQYAQASDYQPVSGVVDLRSTFSDGAYDIQSLVQLARSKGIAALFINDHDLMVMEYGVWPLRNLIRRREERNSILKMGADKYLKEIERVSQANPDMIIIPGSETTPFYYWTGNPLQGKLTAHNHERRMLTIGLDSPSDYENLPILHNHYSVRALRDGLPGILFFAAAFVVGLVMLWWKGSFRIAGMVVLVLSAVLMADGNPFNKSPFDPYHGDRGGAPYQLLIDYVAARGGMTFWNYPETKSGVRQLGPIMVSTRPYPEALLESRGYTGFASLYGEHITVTEPDGVWDMVLKEYCSGLRQRPPWGIATADFHREGESGEQLGNYQTVFYVKEKKKAEILSAMRNGRMYAVQGTFPQVPVMDEFSVSSADRTVKGISGEDVSLRSHPRIKIALSSGKPVAAPVKVRLIRSGSVVHRVDGTLPLQFEYDDTYYHPGEKIYYRMDMRGAGIIVSNPIFVNFVK